MVEHLTSNPEILGSISTGGIVLCPGARHINCPVYCSKLCLTLSLSPKFINYMSNSKANTLNPLQCEGFSHFINKNNSVFVKLPFEILMKR